MSSLTRLEVLEVMNAMTCLNVGPSESITDSSAKFIKALEACNARGFLLCGPIALGLIQVCRIKERRAKAAQKKPEN